MPFYVVFQAVARIAGPLHRTIDYFAPAFVLQLHGSSVNQLAKYVSQSPRLNSFSLSLFCNYQIEKSAKYIMYALTCKGAGNVPC